MQDMCEHALRVVLILLDVVSIITTKIIIQVKQVEVGYNIMRGMQIKTLGTFKPTKMKNSL